MARRSSIRMLPPELRAEIDRLLTDGRHTIREITDHLRGLGADVSKSAVHRYSQGFERVAADIRIAREMAQAMGRELEDLPGGDTGRWIIESLTSLIFRIRTQIADGDAIDVGEFEKLARATRDLQAALKSNVDTELKIRERAARDAAKVAEEAAAEAGLSDATVRTIKERILGIVKR